MLKKIFKFFFYLLVYCKSYYLLSVIYLFSIKKHNLNFFQIFLKRKKRILAIGSSKFREDLEYIKDFKEYDLLSIDHKWQSLLTTHFCSTNQVLNYLDSNENEVFKKESKKMKLFNGKLINILNKIIKIDLIILVNYRYLEDFFWISSFKNLNVNTLMLYREGLLANERIHDEVSIRHKLFINNEIDYIIAPNEIVRNSFLKAKFINANNIFTAGTLRMDKFLNQINSLKKQKNKNSNKVKIFVFFDISENLSLFGKQNDKLTPKKYSYALNIWNKKKFFINEIHRTIIEIAKENPNIKIIIKPKLYEFKKNINGLIYNLIEIKKKQNIPNLHIMPNANSQKLILEADLISGLQSSTILESLIANKKIILPIFDYFKNTPHYNDLFFKDNLDLFITASNKNDYKNKILKYLNTTNQNVQEDIIAKKILLWNKYFYSNKPIFKQKYKEHIDNILS